MAKNPIRYEERRALRDRLLTRLIELSRQRGERDRLAPSGEVAWMPYEREQMLAAVNIERAGRGLPPVGLGLVERVERMAVGHSDYGTKFALYCAEIVLDEKREVW